MRESLQFAASPDIQSSVRKRLQQVLNAYPVEKTDIRIMKAGRYIYITVYILMPEDSCATPLSELDTIRTKILQSFEKSKWRYFIDILFTMDAKDMLKPL